MSLGDFAVLETFPERADPPTGSVQTTCSAGYSFSIRSPCLTPGRLSSFQHEPSAAHKYLGKVLPLCSRSAGERSCLSAARLDSRATILTQQNAPARLFQQSRSVLTPPTDPRFSAGLRVSEFEILMAIAAETHCRAVHAALADARKQTLVHLVVFPFKHLTSRRSAIGPAFPIFGHSFTRFGSENRASYTLRSQG